MHVPGWRAGRRPLLTTIAVVGALSLGAVGCTRTHDLSAAVDETTTTARVQVRRVPRATTTTSSPAVTTPSVAVAGATTTVVPAANPASPPASRRRTTATTTPLSALLAAALRAATATTVPPSATPTTSTTTTMIPANPAAVVVTAQNAVVHQGETQTIAVDNDNDPTVPSLASCAGRDYKPSGGGWVAAGFTSQVGCAVVGDAATLTRTLPANVTFGQYVFCTELAGPTATTVCTAYVVVPYPT